VTTASLVVIHITDCMHQFKMLNRFLYTSETGFCRWVRWIGLGQRVCGLGLLGSSSKVDTCPTLLNHMPEFQLFGNSCKIDVKQPIVMQFWHLAEISVSQEFSIGFKDVCEREVSGSTGADVSTHSSKHWQHNSRARSVFNSSGSPTPGQLFNSSHWQSWI